MNKKLKYPEKVELLKKAVDVSGKKLLSKNPSDEKIDLEISIMLNAIERDDDELEAEEVRICSKLDYTWDEQTAEKFIKDSFFKFVGFDKFGPLDPNFWANFGSAPLFQKYEDEKKKPGIGMDTIFGEKLGECYDYIYEISNMVNSVFEDFKLKKSKLQEKTVNVVSPFKNLADLEDNVTVKKIKAEAEKFYKDTTKDFKDRLEVFDIHGDEDGSIHQPTDKKLAKIFEIYQETGYSERHEMVNCLSIIEWWIDTLKSKRCRISYKENKYHPKIISKKRNYKPSTKAIERLQRYYQEILLEEGVANFEFDW